MKATIGENDYEFWVDLSPETIEELITLFRGTNNAKAEKPSITLSFNTENPYCLISIKKVKPQVQKNTISNY